MGISNNIFDSMFDMLENLSNHYYIADRKDDILKVMVYHMELIHKLDHVNPTDCKKNCYLTRDLFTSLAAQFYEEFIKTKYSQTHLN